MHTTGQNYFSDDLDNSSNLCFDWLKKYCGDTIKGNAHFSKNTSRVCLGLSKDSLDFDFVSLKKSMIYFLLKVMNKENTSFLVIVKEVEEITKSY